MRAFVVSLILLANLILSSTVFSYIEVAGIRPNTWLLIVICFAMLRGDVEGAIVGFFSGLLQDIMFGRAIGLHAALGMATGFLCGKPFKDFYRENFMIPIFLVGAACTAYELAFYFLYFLFQGKVDLLYYFGRIILPETVYTIVVTIPVYRFMYGVNSRLEEHERFTRRMF